MSSQEFSSLVLSDDNGLRLDIYLSKRFSYYSRSEWKEKISKVQVTVSGKESKPGYIVKTGDSISYLPVDIFRPVVDETIGILYEDEWLLVVNKSGNLPVHSSARYGDRNLISILSKRVSEKPLFLVHRIDRETSGIVLVAKDSATASQLTSQFMNKTIRKSYLTYVFGSFPDQLHATGYLGKARKSQIQKKMEFSRENVFQDESQTCETNFEKIEEGNGISKIFAFPKTGRVHQIRATLCSLGYPLLGDKIYGKDEAMFLELIANGESTVISDKLGFSRQALHAFKIVFIHPHTQKEMEIIAPEPDDMKNILRIT